MPPNYWRFAQRNHLLIEYVFHLPVILYAILRTPLCKPAHSKRLVQSIT